MSVSMGCSGSAASGFAAPSTGAASTGGASTGAASTGSASTGAASTSGASTGSAGAGWTWVGSSATVSACEGSSVAGSAWTGSSEAGSAWTLIYPQFTVVIPKPDVVALPMGYVTAYGDPQFLSFLNTWIELKKKDLTIQMLYDYWILGRKRTPSSRRWSVLDYFLSENGGSG